MTESHIDPHMMRLPGEQAVTEQYLRQRVTELAELLRKANETIVIQARSNVRSAEAIQRVRELHAAMSCECYECRHIATTHEPVCKACGDDYAYPCPTINATMPTHAQPLTR